MRDRVKFRVGRLVFVAFSRDETLMGFGFPKDERDALDRRRARQVPAAGAVATCATSGSSCGSPRSTSDEMRELVLDAWRMCVPKKVSALGAMTLGGVAAVARAGRPRRVRRPVGADGGGRRGGPRRGRSRRLARRRRRVLDAGCGTGRVAIELARRGIEVVGVDADPDMLERARRRAPQLDVGAGRPRHARRSGDVRRRRAGRQRAAVRRAGRSRAASSPRAPATSTLGGRARRRAPGWRPAGRPSTSSTRGPPPPASSSRSDTAAGTAPRSTAAATRCRSTRPPRAAPAPARRDRRAGDAAAARARRSAPGSAAPAAPCAAWLANRGRHADTTSARSTAAATDPAAGSSQRTTPASGWPRGPGSRRYQLPSSVADQHERRALPVAEPPEHADRLVGHVLDVLGLHVADAVRVDRGRAVGRRTPRARPRDRCRPPRARAPSCGRGWRGRPRPGSSPMAGTWA